MKDCASLLVWSTPVPGRRVIDTGDNLVGGVAGIQEKKIGHWQSLVTNGNDIEASFVVSMTFHIIILSSFVQVKKFWEKNKLLSDDRMFIPQRVGPRLTVEQIQLGWY
jgi:hypothetical protein